MGSCCCLTQKQGEDNSSAVEELFPYILEPDFKCMEEISMTILFAQIFHSSTLSVYMENVHMNSKFCELSSPDHSCVDGAMVAWEILNPRKECNLFI